MPKKKKRPLHIQFRDSFKYAFRGVYWTFTERNMRFHGIATVVVLAMSCYFPISKVEWMIVLLLIAAMWSAEMVNTAIEELANICRDEMKLSYSATTRARDIAAGSVVIIAVISVIVGVFIFGPHLYCFLDPACTGDAAVPYQHRCGNKLLY